MSKPSIPILAFLLGAATALLVQTHIRQVSPGTFPSDPKSITVHVHNSSPTTVYTSSSNSQDQHQAALAGADAVAETGGESR